MCVNTLSVDQTGIAERFAGLAEGEHGNRFAGARWRCFGGERCPRLDGANAICEGEVYGAVEVGSHTVFFVSIDEIEVARRKAAPLLWHRRHFDTALSCGAASRNPTN
jgi:flavin reductase (NADH)